MSLNVNNELRDTITAKDVIDSLGIDLGLQRRGPKYIGDCITGHPSKSHTCFHVFDTGFYCHSCGAKGNIFELVKLAKGVEYREARDYLIETFRTDLRQYKKQKLQVDEAPSEYYLKALLYDELYKRGRELLYSDEGAEALAYLIGERGYELDKLQATEWIYLLPDAEARTYLLEALPDAGEEEKNYIKGGWEDGKFNGLPLTGYFGDEFRLAFPYRDRYKNITGFLKRALAPQGVTIEKKDKLFEGVRWDSTPGLSKKDLFNIWRYRDTKELLLVEGYPDALYFHTLGLNCVAVGQGALGEEHIKSLKDRGIKSVIISLDNDKEGREQKGEKHTRTAIELLLQAGIRPLVIPPQELGQYKDLDELLRGQGADELKAFIQRNTVSYYQYLLQEILSKYAKIEEDRGEQGLLPKDIEDFLEEVVETAQAIESPLDRQRFTKAFTSIEAIKEYGITEESLQDTVERIRYNKEKAERSESLSQLLGQVKELQAKGEVNEALDVIEAETKELRLKRGAELKENYSYEDWEEDIATAPPALQTGIAPLDKILRIPQGAITLIAGRPRHGKTTLMYNLLLSMSEKYPNNKFYFLSYEEPKKYLLLKILNRLVGADLVTLYGRDYGVNTSLELLKAYLKDRRTDIAEVESGKAKLRGLLNEGRIEVIGQNYTVEELASLIPYLAQRDSVGAVYLDYIQKIPTEQRVNSIRERIAHVSNGLLNIAKETELPLILGAQFNRDGAKGSRPTLENLKEAGNLEEDANLVLALYNQSVEVEEDEDGVDLRKERVVDLRIDILKNRDGGYGTAFLDFDRYTATLEEKKASVI